MSKVLRFSKNLKKLREREGYSQRLLAEKLNVSDSSICAYEKGARLPDIYLFSDIAEIFEISIDVLTYGEIK